MRAYTIIRVSAQDQLKGYGADIQWEDDILLNASSLGLETPVEYRRIIQEPATGWDRQLFEAKVREGLMLYHKGEVQAMLFPRVDRETRFVFGSFTLLAEVLRTGMPVFFARERFRLDPMNPEPYLSKAIQAQAYVATMRENTMRATRKRAEKDHRMPTGGKKCGYNYHHYRNYQVADANSGRYTVNQQEGAWLCKLKDWILVDGLSLKKCEKKVGELTGIKLNRATLLRILTDPIVVGKVYAYRHKVIIDHTGRKRRQSVPESEWVLVYEDPGLRIFSDEEFHGLKRQFERNKRNSPRNTKHHYPPLKSIVVCGACQAKMQALTTNRGTAYYRCPSCRNHINAWWLWRNVRDYLTRVVLDPEILVKTIKENYDSGQLTARFEQELMNLEREKDGWQRARMKQRRLYLLPDGNYSEQDYLSDDKRIQSELDKTMNRIVGVKQQILESRESKLDQEGIERFCQNVAQNLNQMTDNQWRLLVEALQLKVTAKGKATFIEGAVPIDNENTVLQPA